MHYGKLLKNAMCAGLIISLTLTAGGTSALSATMGRENHLAGLSVYIEENDTSGVISKLIPEEESTVAVSESAISVSGQAVTVEDTTKKKKSAFEKKGLSIANDYVCIRAKKSTDSKILGKLHRGCIATIEKNGREWVKVTSGSVKGYVKKEYLAIGENAEEISEKFAIKKARVQTETLMVREKKSTESKILELVGYEDDLKVLKNGDDWVKVRVNRDTVGYVSADYVKVVDTFKKAEEIKKEEPAAVIKQVVSLKKQSGSKSSVTQQKRTVSRTKSSPKTTTENRTVKSSTGSAIASYALKFVGNPYVYGGTSLTNGADCSGFTQSVFRNFGISLPRTSGSQAGVGRSVSLSSAQAGDLIFYAKNGAINHVAICIGNGRVVHASNPKNGILTSDLYYRTPVAARRVW